MSYPTKTYKVHPFYKTLFDCVFEVMNAQKSPFLEWMMDKHLGTGTKEKLARFNYNGLFINMIRELEEKLKQKDFDELSFKLRTGNRFIELMGAYQESPNASRNQVIFTVRVSDSVVSEVVSLKKGYKLKDVVHLAMLNYVEELDEETYLITRETFLTAINKERET